MADDASDFDDDGELELEPIDPEILAHEKRRADERTASALSKVDVDEIVRKGAYEDLDVNFDAFRNFRFTTRHLLIATAILSIVMALYTTVESCMTLFLIGLAMLAAGWFWVLRTEKKNEEERQRRRKELLAGGYGLGDREFDQLEEEAPASGFSFKLQFSMKQAMIAFAVAALVMTVLKFVAPGQLSVMLGMIALIGLAIHVVGFDPPPAFVFGWWILLVLYILFGLLSMVWPDEEDQGAQLERSKPSLMAQLAPGSFDSARLQIRADLLRAAAAQSNGRRMGDLHCWTSQQWHTTQRHTTRSLSRAWERARARVFSIKTDLNPTTYSVSSSLRRATGVSRA